jgi:uncharacterized protein YggU (UPF0235/DUF167 family)
VRAEGLSIEVALAAPPVDGAANAKLIELVADVLRIPKSAVRLVLGDSSKHKVLEVAGLTAEDVADRLCQAVGAVGPSRP